jgi:hypothetical protein
MTQAREAAEELYGDQWVEVYNGEEGIQREEREKRKGDRKK